ncbi:MAG: tryptophan synthase subunit alpha [Bacteroidota bacterium]|nr:tryptophan synthase subunit alpha [Bacteroidota bacterium]
MNRLNKLFKDKTANVLSVYFTAGYPKLDDTCSILSGLQNNGVDMIEIGMPFSDPLADGPTIQRSSEIALENGMSIRLLFQQLANAKIASSSSSVLLMGYLNPVLQYGIERFCKDASALGIDGVIIPDLPMQEYLDEYKAIFESYDLKNIFLITPQTSEERIRYIDSHSTAFIYMVSSFGTTGAKSGIGTEQENYFKRINEMKLKNPVMIGFGISDHHTFSKACEYANGAIIGSAFIKAISENPDLDKSINNFISSVKNKNKEVSA